MHILRRLALAPALLLLGAATCDLSFSVDTDWQRITLDMSALGLKLPAGAKVIPTIPCTNNTECGNTVLECQNGSFSCKTVCESKKCVLVATLQQPQSVDLSQKIRNQTTATVLSKVTLDRIVYNVDENSLTVATPQVDLFVGPAGAKTSNDAGVVQFATVPSIPPGTVRNDVIPTTDAGKAALEGKVYDYRTPFTIIGKATLRLRSGDAVPTGKISLKTKAYFAIDPLS